MFEKMREFLNENHLKPDKITSDHAERDEDEDSDLCSPPLPAEEGITNECNSIVVDDD